MQLPKWQLMWHVTNSQQDRSWHFTNSQCDRSWHFTNTQCDRSWHFNCSQCDRSWYFTCSQCDRSWHFTNSQCDRSRHFTNTLLPVNNLFLTEYLVTVAVCKVLTAHLFVVSDDALLGDWRVWYIAMCSNSNTFLTGNYSDVLHNKTYLHSIATWHNRELCTVPLQSGHILNTELCTVPHQFGHTLNTELCTVPHQSGHTLNTELCTVPGQYGHIYHRTVYCTTSVWTHT